MPSQLVGLMRKLTWANFQGNAPANSPWAAQTASGFRASPPTFDNNGGTFKLRDQVTVNIVFDANRSWRVNMNQWPTQLQQDLLDHEQGHYTISALNARDLFIRLMGLKNSTYASQADGMRDYNDWIRIFNDREKKIQAEYDSDTGHSQANVFTPSSGMVTPPPQKSSTQEKWERLIAKAFVELRQSGGAAPDGTLYKKDLIDVLLQNGITFDP